MKICDPQSAPLLNALQWLVREYSRSTTAMLAIENRHLQNFLSIYRKTTFLNNLVLMVDGKEVATMMTERKSARLLIQYTTMGANHVF